MQELKNYINKYIIKPIFICFGKKHQRHDMENKVKCEWIACANNINGKCSCKEIKLKNITFDKVNYLNCNSFDFE